MLAYKNTYVPPPPPEFAQDIHLHTPAAEYDLNFIFASPPIDVLKADGIQVELEPLVPSEHAQAIFEVLSKLPDHFKYCPGTPWKTLQECLEWIETFHRSAPSALFHVIRDLKGGERKIAGLCNYIRTSHENLTSELGWIFIFPEFQRTHVMTETAFLMLDHAFKLPFEGGWGLRRMQWQANDMNKPSVNAAVRLGFILETPVSLRADRGLSPGQVGAYIGRDGDPLSLKGAKVGRNTAMLSITAEEWETKTREHVLGLINRYK